MSNEQPYEQYCKDHPNDKVNCLLAYAMRNLSEGERISLKDSLIERTPKEVNEHTQEQLPEWMEFIKACKNQRYNFCAGIGALPWNTTTRTLADDILIMYDQLVERYSRMQEENNKLREGIAELQERVKKMDFMIGNGLGYDDMEKH